MGRRLQTSEKKFPTGRSKQPCHPLKRVVVVHNARPRCLKAHSKSHVHVGGHDILSAAHKTLYALLKPDTNTGGRLRVRKGDRGNKEPSRRPGMDRKTSFDDDRCADQLKIFHYAAVDLADRAGNGKLRMYRVVVPKSSIGSGEKGE